MTLLKSYYQLCKPNVVYMMLICAFVGMLLAEQTVSSYFYLFIALTGIALCAASAAAINQVVDREVDASMTRTDQRPLPKGFGVPIQRPQGFGKQEWQKPQQPIPQQQSRVQTRHSFGVYNYYYYTPNPYFNRYYRVPAYRPPVIIQPQPVPIYPAPFHGFFFQFRW